MKLSIVADDGLVCVDGVCFGSLTLPQLPDTVHAVQWYGAFGEVEFRNAFVDGRIVKPENQVITDLAPYMFAVEAWQTAKDAADAQAAEVAAQIAAAEEAERLRLEQVERDRIAALEQNEEAQQALQAERDAYEAARLALESGGGEAPIQTEPNAG